MIGSRPRSLPALIFLGIALLITGAMVVSLFSNIPTEGTMLAVDWRSNYDGIAGGYLQYGNLHGLFMPPWDAVLIAPLGLIPARFGWGIVAFVTLVVMILSVPRAGQKGRFWLATVLMVISFPSLRHMVDGELEVFVIGGTLIILYAYQTRRVGWLVLGLLLVVAKPQEALLLVVTVALYALPELLQPRLRSFWLKAAAGVAVVVIPALLWKGSEWLAAIFSIRQWGTIMDTSLHAALNRIGLPTPVLWLLWLGLLAATLFVVWRSRPTLSREKAGLLIAASLLLAPYAAGNSILTVLVIGVVPLFLRKPWIGGFLMAMISLPFLFSRDLLYYGQAYYGTLTLFVCWAVFAWRVWNRADERVRFAVPVRSTGIPASAES